MHEDQYGSGFSESRWEAFINTVDAWRCEAQDCPTSEELAAHFKGQLESRRQALISQHIMQCAFCRRELRAVYKAVRAGTLTSTRQYKTAPRPSKFASLQRDIPFIGRAEQVEHLKRYWEQAQSGKGQVVEIIGKPGIGKSRLLQEFRRKVVNNSTTYLVGHCDVRGRPIPYLPLSALLRQQCQATETDSSTVLIEKVRKYLQQLDIDPNTSVRLLTDVLGTGLNRRVGDFGSMTIKNLSDSTPGGVATRALPHHRAPWLSHPTEALGTRVETALGKRNDLLMRQEQTFNLLNYLFLRICQYSPLIVEVEDLQWIDATSESYFAKFVQRLTTMPLLLVVTYRPTYEPPWGKQFHMSQITLRPLSSIESRTVVQEVLQRQPFVAPLSQQSTGQNWGNPFFLEELAYAAVDRRDWSSAKQLPNTISEVLATRIGQLSPKAKQLLQAAAVIGMEIRADLLRSIAPISAIDFAENFQYLQDARFLVREQSMLGLTYKFKHVLTLNAAYESIQPSIKQEYHRKIAQILAEHFPQIAETQPELLAYHYTRAKLYKEAINSWYRASKRALLRSAYSEAIHHLYEGLDVLKKSPRPTELLEQKLDLLEALITALRVTKGYAAPELEDLCHRALILCTQGVGKLRQQLAIIRFVWAYHLNQGRLNQARKIGKTLLKKSLPSKEDSPLLLVESYYVVGNTLYHLGELVQALNYLQQGVDLYRSQPHSLQTDAFFFGQDTYVACLSIMVPTLWLLGYPDQAQTRLDEACVRASQVAHPFSEAYAWYYAAMLYQFCGEEQAVRKQAEALFALSNKQGFAQRLMHAALLCGWTWVTQGREDAGINQMCEALEGLRTNKVELGRSYGLCLLAEAYRKRGQIDQGLHTLTEALEAIQNTGEHRLDAEIYRLRGELLLKRSVEDQKEAEQCFHQALKIARIQQAKSLELRAAISLSQLLQQQGKHANAHQQLAEVYDWFTEGFNTADLQKAKALLGRGEPKVHEEY